MDLEETSYFKSLSYPEQVKAMRDELKRIHPNLMRDGDKTPSKPEMAMIYASRVKERICFCCPTLDKMFRTVLVWACGRWNRKTKRHTILSAVELSDIRFGKNDDFPGLSSLKDKPLIVHLGGGDIYNKQIEETLFTVTQQGIVSSYPVVFWYIGTKQSLMVEYPKIYDYLQKNDYCIADLGIAEKWCEIKGIDPMNPPPPPFIRKPEESVQEKEIPKEKMSFDTRTPEGKQAFFEELQKRMKRTDSQQGEDDSNTSEKDIDSIKIDLSSLKKSSKAPEPSVSLDMLSIEKQPASHSSIAPADWPKDFDVSGGLENKDYESKPSFIQPREPIHFPIPIPQEQKPSVPRYETETDSDKQISWPDEKQFYEVGKKVFKPFPRGTSLSKEIEAFTNSMEGYLKRSLSSLRLSVEEILRLWRCYCLGLGEFNKNKVKLEQLGYSSYEDVLFTAMNELCCDISVDEFFHGKSGWICLLKKPKKE